MDDYLSHHGILGQKWGVRRYQNADGSLTNAGKRRYRSSTKTVERLGNRIVKRESEMRKDNNILKTLSLHNKQMKDLEHYKEAEEFIRSLGHAPMSELENKSSIKTMYAQSPYNNPYDIVWLPGDGLARYQMTHY